MEARVRKTENILMNHDTVEVLGDEQVVAKALNKTTNEEFEIPVTGFFCHWANQILIF
jgi:thioredoxin reductase (NADPH)